MIDSDGRTVLCSAAQQGSVEVVQLLLDRGLDETHRDNCGWSPLHIAAFEGHTEVCSTCFSDTKSGVSLYFILLKFNF